jgi:hypothetical protein
MHLARSAAPAAPAAAKMPHPAMPEDPSERCELRVFRDQPGGERIVVVTEPGKITEFQPDISAKRSRLTRELMR